MSPLLQLDAVSKTYQRGRERVVALRSVDLSVQAGEFVAVVGRSGSGKSTLLHLAGGLDMPDTGRVVVDGQDVGAMSVRDRARFRRRAVGFVFQFFHLIPTLTVAENVELPLALDGVRNTRETVLEWIERVGLTDRADHLPGELSGGEMQRTAIARALVTRPRLLLADEPTGNLDTATGNSILDLLAAQADEDTALLMVTHDDSAAARADRVLRVSDGGIATVSAASDGTPRVGLGD